MKVIILLASAESGGVKQGPFSFWNKQVLHNDWFFLSKVVLVLIYSYFFAYFWPLPPVFGSLSTREEVDGFALEMLNTFESPMITENT